MVPTYATAVNNNRESVFKIILVNYIINYGICEKILQAGIQKSKDHLTAHNKFYFPVKEKSENER